MTHYDTVVIGLGGVGSATAMHLANAGKRVLGLEQFALNHARGSSHGETRIFRQAYFEHPDYVPLLKRAYRLWQDLQFRTDRSLYLETGLLEVGPPNGAVIPNVLKSAEQHGLPVEQIDRDDFTERFAGFLLPPGMRAVLEKNAGVLFVEKCVQTHLDQARIAGATLHDEEAVTNWSSNEERVKIRTSRGVYTADSLVIAGGAWSEKLLSETGIQLRVLKKHMHWYGTSDRNFGFDKRMGRGCPAFFYETRQGYFYGFPSFNLGRLKVCEHSGGELLSDPADFTPSIDREDQQRVSEFLSEYLPSSNATHHSHQACMYTMSHDEHFYVDLHPQHKNVSYAAGLSGHGFKFTPVLGELLAKMATTQTRQPETAFLSLNRA